MSSVGDKASTFDDEPDFSAGEDEDLDLSFFDDPEIGGPLKPKNPESCVAVNSVRMRTLNEGKIPPPWVHDEVVTVRLTKHDPVNYLWFREPDNLNTLTDIYELPLNSDYFVDPHKLQEGIFRYSEDDRKLHYQRPEDPQSFLMRSKAFAKKLAELNGRYRKEVPSKPINDADANKAIFVIAWTIDDEGDGESVIDDARTAIHVGTVG